VDCAKRWTVVIDIDRRDGECTAVARLHSRDADRLIGTGSARLDSIERTIPTLGDELATARALDQLSRHLRDAAQNESDRVPAREAWTQI
jgi:Domain of unknown function (DUF1876)